MIRHCNRMLRQLDLTSTEWINPDWQMDHSAKTGSLLPQGVSLTRPSRLTLILCANPLTAHRFPT
jgi:hypothetical protein